MQKIIFLLPPSEGKTFGGIFGKEKLRLSFSKPKDIVQDLTQKDLKCIGKRFEEAQNLNALCCEENILELLPAIERYTGVMYKAIDFSSMTFKGKEYFSQNFVILSGMYGLLKPQDLISNYKLPIEAKGLSKYWKNNITETLNTLKIDVIVDLLPESYKKMIDWKYLHSKIIQVEFLTKKQGEFRKVSHGVKAIKGKYIKSLCEEGGGDFGKTFGEENSTAKILV